MRRSRLPAVLVVLAAVALLVGACGLPTPGGVRVDRPVGGSANDEPDIRKLPPGPQDGQSPQQIVLGFIEAAGADQSLAQRFLAPATNWPDPSSGTVYDAATLSGVEVTGDGPTRHARVHYVALAQLDPDGGVHPAGRNEVRDYDLRLVDGQWRLSTVPPGTLLSQRDLARGYRLITPYFYDLQQTRLVADPRYLPVSGPDSLPTAAVHALAAGASSWLRPVVRSAFGAQIDVPASVTVSDGGVATVDLSREALELPKDQRRLLVEQLAATLGSVPGVLGVQVLADDRPYDSGLPSVVPVQPPEMLLPRHVGPATLLDSRKRPTVAGGPPLPLAGPVTAVVPDAANQRLAVETPTSDGVALRVVAADATAAAGQPALTGQLSRPSWVGADGVLVVQQALNQSQLLFVPANGGAVGQVTLAGLPLTAGALQSVSVSRDGVRIVLITGAPGARQAWLGRLDRTASPLVAAGWTPLTAALGDVAQASWADDVTLALLGTRDSGPTAGPASVWELDLDDAAPPVALPALPPELTFPEAVAAGPAQPVLAAGNGLVWELVNGRWQQLAAGSVPAYPGG